jgi:transposase
MIETDKRKAIYLLHQEGMSVREIARRLGVSRNTVRRAIQRRGETVHTVRKDKKQIDPELLQRLHQECDGRVQRMREKLVEEEGIPVQYSTLTRMVRELGLGVPPQTRCQHVPDEPGQEMQHDTTVYTIKLGDQRSKLVASLIYLRYSKRRYLKFYRAFNRFKMKCFFHEALMHWGYSARQCIIDNTNLARWRGTGRNAVMVPEMAAFAKPYAFEFICHEKGHCNRKAGEERSFWTVETNFFPGRSFRDFEDLNQQAWEWSAVRMENRPQAKTGLIPAKAFEYERGFLTPLPSHLPAPYRVLDRVIDEYGYVAVDGNFFWVPGDQRGGAKVLCYAQHLQVYQNRERLVEYLLPADSIHNRRISPEGLPPPPYQPKHRKQPTLEEEKRLRALGQPVSAYVDFILQSKGLGRHQFLRKLLALSQKMSSELFVKTIERAVKYRISCLETIQRIALLYLHQGPGVLPSPAVDEQFTQRDSYLEGFLTEAPDLSLYQTPPNSPTDPDHE